MRLLIATKVLVACVLSVGVGSYSNAPCFSQDGGKALKSTNHTKSVDVEKLANAIFKAEGVNSRHPYGILAKYKHTTPRQACLNTIASSMKRWEAAGRPGEFIPWLGRTYCPVGAANDPTGLNKNWVRNVTYFYERG